MFLQPRFYLAFSLLLISLAIKADPITVSAGSSVTLFFTSATNSAARAEASYALSADGHTVAMNFRNTSTDANIGLWAMDISSQTSYFNQVGDYKWTSNVSALPAGVNWFSTPTDNFAANTFTAKSITSLLDLTLFKQVGFRGQDFATYGFLAPGQSGLATLSFAGTTNGFVTLPLTNFVIGSVSAGFVVKAGNNADFLTSNQGTKIPFSIPEPASLLLLGAGLAAIGLQIRRQKH